MGSPPAATYCNLETEEIRRFQTDRSREELETWFSGVVHEYFKWARYLYHHELTRDASIRHLNSVYLTGRKQRDLFVVSVSLDDQPEKTPVYPGSHGNRKDALHCIPGGPCHRGRKGR